MQEIQPPSRASTPQSSHKHKEKTFKFKDLGSSWKQYWIWRSADSKVQLTKQSSVL